MRRVREAPQWQDVEFNDPWPERRLIGYLAAHPERFTEAVSLPSSALHDGDVRKIFEAMKALDAAGDLNAGTLFLAAIRIGMKDELTRCQQEYDLTGTPAAYALRAIRERERRRQLWVLGEELRRIAVNKEESTDTAVDVADRIIETLSETGRLDVVSLRDVAIAYTQKKRTMLDTVRSVLSGNAAIDRITLGFERGHMSLIGARPGEGKTASARQFGTVAAMRGENVLFFSGEMPATEQADGALAQTMGINLTLIRTANVESSPDFLKQLETGSAALPGCFYVYDKPGMTTNDIVSVARRMHYKLKEEGKGGLDLIIVDYLQLMGDDDDDDSYRTYKIGRISRRLRNLARILDCALLVLAQLNRESVKEGKKRRPNKADLRESGAIEADADLIMFIYHPDGKPGVVEWIVDKNRNGPQAIVEGRWRGEFTRFDDVPEYEAGAGG